MLAGGDYIEPPSKGADPAGPQQPGGEQRHRSKLVDACVEDDADAIRAAVRAALRDGVPPRHRSDRHEDFLACLAAVDPTLQARPEAVRALYERGL